MEVRQEFSAAGVQRETVLTIGVFDGVHRGHRVLLDTVSAVAEKRGLASCVVTFKNRPITVIRPDVPVYYMLPLAERLRLLGEAGMDYVVPVTFTRSLSQHTADEFARILREELRMRVLVVGPDFALGKNRKGTADVLAHLGNDMGFDVKIVEPLLNEDERISSTAIRAALADGDVQKAASLLGRPYSLSGAVVRGEQRGKTIGFPTANIETHEKLFLPADGVYCSVAHIGSQARDSVTNIGVRPTFGELKHTVETFIFDFDGDLYGTDLRIDLIERIRPERRFDGVDALVAQLKHDVQTARELLAARVSE